MELQAWSAMHRIAATTTDRRQAMGADFTSRLAAPLFASGLLVTTLHTGLAVNSLDSG
jgi:hypothetical protein